MGRPERLIHPSSFIHQNMSIFRYEAIDQAGKIVMGAMDAASMADVNARLTEMGFRPQQVIAPPSNGAGAQSNVTGQTAPTQHATLVTSKLSGAKAKDLALFFRQFASLVRSGISLYQALENLGPRSSHPALVQTAREMAEAAHGGGRISDVMEKYPRLYAG